MSEWDDLQNIPDGTVLKEWQQDGLCCKILRARMALCAYTGVPYGHPFYGKKHNELDIQCHGGLTFSSSGGQEWMKGDWTKGYWWLGWDYAHGGDKMMIPSALRENPVINDIFGSLLSSGETEWTTSKVEQEVLEVLYQFPKIQENLLIEEKSRLERVIGDD